MPQRAKLLYMLQRIDTLLAVKKRRYREVQEHLGENQGLQEARAALKATEEELAHQRFQLRDQELETASVAAKIRATEESLYGGKVANPKELADLQHEGEYLARRKTALEEAQLELMVTVERLTQKAATANERYLVMEAAWRSENTELSAEYDALREELSGLLSKRKAMLRHIDQEDLAEYDAIRRLHSGVAVVAARNGVCQVCNVQVPHRDFEQAKDSDQIFYCSGCERILYVPEK